MRWLLAMVLAAIGVLGSPVVLFGRVWWLKRKDRG